MRFGLFFQAPEAAGQTHAERYAEMLDLVALADSLGFDVAAAPSSTERGRARRDGRRPLRWTSRARRRARLHPEPVPWVSGIGVREPWPIRRGARDHSPRVDR